MATKVFYNFQIVGALYQTPGGREAEAGDEITIFLDQTRNGDFPASIPGLLQNPIKRVNVVSGGCLVEGTSYSFSYDSDDLEDASGVTLSACDISSISVTSCCEALRADLLEETAARTAADAALQDGIDGVQDDLDTWDVITLSAEPVQGVAGVPQVETQTMVGTIATSGTLIATVTGAGITGSPLAVSFDVDAGDVPSVSAAKAAAKLATVAAITALYTPSNIGPDFALTEIVPNGNDGTLNIEITNGTATGLTPDASSTNTVAGIAAVTGTAASRIGQHARWGDRIWEAVATSPATWVEITTARNSAYHESARDRFVGGDGTTALDDMVVTTTHDLGRFEILEVSGVAYNMELIAGTDAENVPYVVRPNNYGATNPDGSTNNLTWVLRPAATVSAAILDASAGQLGVPDEGKVPVFGEDGSLGITTILYFANLDTFTASISAAGLTDNYNQSIPNAGGVYKLDPIVVDPTPLTGFTITASRYVDQTHFLQPAGTLATGTFNLPAAADSRVGQIVRVHSTEQVTAATVAVSGGGTINGAAVTQFAADTTYAFQCVRVTGSGVWIRIQ